MDKDNAPASQQIKVHIDIYFDQLILRKIIKTVATRCQILTLKWTKIDFGWGGAGGAYSAPTDPVAGFKGAYVIQTS